MGHRDFEGQEAGEVLERFGGDLARARERYRRFVAEGIGVGRREDLVRVGKRGGQAQDGGDGNEAKDSRILGDQEFSGRPLRNRPLREKGCALFSLSRS